MPGWDDVKPVNASTESKGWEAVSPVVIQPNETPVQKGWRMAKPFVEPIVETAGGIGGAALGAAGGAAAGGVGAIPGAVAGSGLGYGIGKGLIRLGDVYLGGQVPPSIGNQALNAIGDIGTGAAMEMGGQAAAPIIKALAKPVRGALGFWKGGGQLPSFTPKAVVESFEAKLPGEAADVVKSQLKAQYDADRMAASVPFNNLRANGGIVDMSPYVKSVDDAIASVQASGYSDKEAIIKQLQSLRKVAAEEGPVNWNKALDIGSDINNKISLADRAGENNLERILTPLKQAHMNALDAAGSVEGAAYKAAKENWINKVVPWEDREMGGQILQSFMKNPTPDTALSALMKARSNDKIGYFVDQLKKTPNGMQALRAGLARDVYKDSLNDAHKVIPDKFIGALQDRMDMYGEAFKGSDKWIMDGLDKLMRDARFISRLDPVQMATLGVGSIGKAIGGKDAVGAIIQNLVTSPMGSKFLLEAHGLTPGSKAMGQLVDRYWPKFIGQAASGATDIWGAKQENPSEQYNFTLESK